MRFSLLWHLGLVNTKIQQIGVLIPLSSVCVGVGETGSFLPTVTGNLGPCVSATDISYSPGTGLLFVSRWSRGQKWEEANRSPSLWFRICAAQLSPVRQPAAGTTPDVSDLGGDGPYPTEVW